MSMHDPGSKSAPVLITEDEGALYDRQIRLWGLEAQQRMRNATIAVFTLRGTATETIKNIVLAGIGKLLVVDDADVAEEDLGAGFFFRDEDVGKKRVDVARGRIESLNPLVTVQTEQRSLLSTSDADLVTLLSGVDLVCLTDADRDTCIRVNKVCRERATPLYCGGTFGMLGYIFCDLLSHEYIAPDRSAVSKDGPKTVKATATYAPLDVALKHSWSALSRRQTREINPAAVFTVQAIWEYQSLHQGVLPTESAHADELEKVANDLVDRASVNKQVLTSVPREQIDAAATTAAHEFSPVCAVVGGMLAQDILKALGARETPLANFFVFDGATGAGTVARLAMP